MITQNVPQPASVDVRPAMVALLSLKCYSKRASYLVYHGGPLDMSVQLIL